MEMERKMNIEEELKWCSKRFGVDLEILKKELENTKETLTKQVNDKKINMSENDIQSMSVYGVIEMVKRDEL